MNATIRGTFCLKGRVSTRQLPFESTGVIPLGHDEERKARPAPRPKSRAPVRLP